MTNIIPQYICWNIFQKSNAFSLYPTPLPRWLEAGCLRKAKICRYLRLTVVLLFLNVVQVLELLLQNLFRAHWGPNPTSLDSFGSLNASRPFGLRPIPAELWICPGASCSPIQKYITYIKTQFCLQLWVQVRSHLKRLRMPERKLR